MLTEQQGEQIEQRAVEIAAEAADFAEHSPDPDVEELGRYVYGDGE
jgi:TPP-dependent pyruvate/acetoin dehydrogenase alpha subunit